MFLLQRIAGPRRPTTEQTDPPKPTDSQQWKLTNLSGGARETIRRCYRTVANVPILVSRSNFA